MDAESVAMELVSGVFPDLQELKFRKASMPPEMISAFLFILYTDLDLR